MNHPDLGTTASPGQLSGRAWTERHGSALMSALAVPRRVLVRGEGCYVWDADGFAYLDLLGGLAVNSLGYAHPRLVSAITEQLATLGHISNVFASPPQVMLAERLLELLGSVAGKVFFTNSGAEANEAAFKIARRTGRPTIVAAAGGFHGRTMGALALTGKPSIQEPFTPLPAGVIHVPFGDVDALADVVDDGTAAVVLEPIQGEAGVRLPPVGYLAAAREITQRHGALLVLDEIQTGLGRTGQWFAHTTEGIVPDVITIAKGLGGGFPVGACIGIGPAADLLGSGSHGTTFGGNPVAAAAGLAVIKVIEQDDVLAHVRAMGERLRSGIAERAHPGVSEVRGRGLLIGIDLSAPVATDVAATAMRAGFIINAIAPETIRLAPPLILAAGHVDEFVDAFPAILDHIGGSGAA